MLKQVTVTELQRCAAEILDQLAEEPVIISQRGKPAAVLLAADVYEKTEQALEEVDARRVRDVVDAGLASAKAGRVSAHSDVVRRARRARSSRKRA